MGMGMRPGNQGPPPPDDTIKGSVGENGYIGNVGGYSNGWNNMGPEPMPGTNQNTMNGNWNGEGNNENNNDNKEIVGSVGVEEPTTRRPISGDNNNMNGYNGGYGMENNFGIEMNNNNWGPNPWGAALK
ncbi:unnamed protein product [Caenorhabditis bovis]|uniref:Uncharacterized protein n=1 Tax=Caenorhabditis bovis TaxID=2654633 RepID=A0A8S1EI03_9PELO|nr:unnamed protein product [Caenorhabditis bovis]